MLIPKVILTSSIIGKRLICQTSFTMAFLMKDDVNGKMFNATPKTLIPFNGVLNWDGVSKLSNAS
jgi:hypothetical protein